MIISVEGEIPASLLLKFLQHMRNFDQEHADCHFEMFASGDDVTDENIKHALANVHPPFKIVEKFRKQ
jgi:hypothetical protein